MTSNYSLHGNTLAALSITQTLAPTVFSLVRKLFLRPRRPFQKVILSVAMSELFTKVSLVRSQSDESALPRVPGW